MAVERLGGQALDLLELLLEVFVPALLLEIIEERLLVRIDDDHAVDAVKDDHVAGLDRGRNALQAHGRRNAQGAGKDRRMGRPAAGIGREAQDLVLAHHQRIAGSEIVGDDHRLILDVRKAFLPVPDQVPKHAFADLLDVVLAFAQILILDRSRT